MDISFQIGGFRSIKSMPFVELRPVTLLIGLNNSGKSTFLRTLPLLKQSLNYASDSPISWYGDLVDFGNFMTSVNNDMKEKKISFGFKFSSMDLLAPNYNNLGYHIHDIIIFFSELFQNLTGDGILNDVCINLNVKDHKNNNDISLTVFESISISIGNSEINFKIIYKKDGNSIKNIEIDDNYLSEFIQHGDIYPINYNLYFDDLAIKLSKAENSSENSTKISKKDMNRHSRSDNLSLSELIRQIETLLCRGPSEDYLGLLPKSEVVVAFFEKISNCFREPVENAPDYARLEQILKQASQANRKIVENFGKLVLFYLVYDRIFYFLQQLLSDLIYLGPDRVDRKRHYRIKNSETPYLDCEGNNLSLFFSYIGEKKLNEFSNWIKKFYPFGINIQETENHAEIKVEFSNKSLNIADTGFGISQILPVLARIWWTSQQPYTKNRIDSDLNLVPRTILLEEPELHLHPIQQASLADAITDVVTLRRTTEIPSPKFIIETHSEKIISRFSYLMQEDKINHDDVQVVYFSSDPEKPFDTTVQVCNFNSEGKLENFPFGFFNSR